MRGAVKNILVLTRNSENSFKLLGGGGGAAVLCNCKIVNCLFRSLNPNIEYLPNYINIRFKYLHN